MTSTYLLKPLRSEIEYLAQRAKRDGQPDIVYQGDNLRRARDHNIGRAAFCRRQVSLLRRGPRPLAKEDLAFVSWARTTHSNSIAKARAYDALIKERDMQKLVFGDVYVPETEDGE